MRSLQLLSHVLVLALLLPLPLARAHSQPSLRLLHRLLLTSDFDSDAPFLPRASLYLSGTAPAASPTLVPADSPSADILDLLAAPDDLSHAVYQLALERPAGDHADWLISSVKACHLPQSTADSLVVHLDADGTPFALDYFLAPIPHDGVCPKKRNAKRAESLASTPAFTGFANTTVSVASPRPPPLPLLRTPPPLSPQGQPVKPQPEQSFIQKYWIYMVALLLVLTFSGGGGGEEGGAGGGGGR